MSKVSETISKTSFNEVSPLPSWAPAYNPMWEDTFHSLAAYTLPPGQYALLYAIPPTSLFTLGSWEWVPSWIHNWLRVHDWVHFIA